VKKQYIYIYEGLNSERTYKVELVVKNTAGQISKKSIIVKTKTAIPIEEVLTADKVTYVNFADATGVKRKCVVLYDSSSEYGIEIITMDTVKDTSYYEKAGYDNYVSNLNNEASKYTCGLRTVFHLKSGTKVVGGDGTEDNPYELGV